MNRTQTIMPPVEAAALTSLESQARYITRPALAIDALQNWMTAAWPWKHPHTKHGRHPAYARSARMASPHQTRYSASKWGYAS